MPRGQADEVAAFFGPRGKPAPGQFTVPLFLWIGPDPAKSQLCRTPKSCRLIS